MSKNNDDSDDDDNSKNIHRSKYEERLERIKELESTLYDIIIGIPSFKGYNIEKDLEFIFELCKCFQIVINEYVDDEDDDGHDANNVVYDDGEYNNKIKLNKEKNFFYYLLDLTLIYLNDSPGVNFPSLFKIPPINNESISTIQFIDFIQQLNIINSMPDINEFDYFELNSIDTKNVLQIYIIKHIVKEINILNGKTMTFEEYNSKIDINAYEGDDNYYIKILHELYTTSDYENDFNFFSNEKKSNNTNKKKLSEKERNTIKIQRLNNILNQPIYIDNLKNIYEKTFNPDWKEKSFNFFKKYIVNLIDYNNIKDYLSLYKLFQIAEVIDIKGRSGQLKNKDLFIRFMFINDKDLTSFLNNEDIQKIIERDDKISPERIHYEVQDEPDTFEGYENQLVDEILNEKKIIIDSPSKLVKFAKINFIEYFNNHGITNNFNRYCIKEHVDFSNPLRNQFFDSINDDNDNDDDEYNISVDDFLFNTDDKNHNAVDKLILNFLQSDKVKILIYNCIFDLFYENIKSNIINDISNLHFELNNEYNTEFSMDEAIGLFHIEDKYFRIRIYSSNNTIKDENEFITKYLDTDDFIESAKNYLFQKFDINEEYLDDEPYIYDYEPEVSSEDDESDDDESDDDDDHVPPPGAGIRPG